MITLLAIHNNLIVQTLDDQVWDVNGQSYRYQKNIKTRDDGFEIFPTAVKAISEVGDEWVGEAYALLTSLKDQAKLTICNQVAFLFKSVKTPR